MVMGNPLTLNNYPFPLNSPIDDGGMSTNLTTTSLYDTKKYWTPGIWQGALLVISVGSQIYNTIITDNGINTLIFPRLPLTGMTTTNVSYILKRLPPTLVRYGISLTATQALKEFAHIASNLVPFPYPVPWVRPGIPPGGSYTLVAPSTTVMTDGLASFTPHYLMGMVIFNVTDKSYGLVLDNTATTITTTPLAGGISNSWVTGAAYILGQSMVDVDTGIQNPFVIPAGSFMELAAESWSYDQDNMVYLLVDGLLMFAPGTVNGGSLSIVEVVAGLTTLTYDPTASNSHTIDIIVFNKGLSYMYGAANFICILDQYAGE
jgi:hypothetical protein